MDLCITPGIDKLYRLALVGPGDRFEALSEHDTPEAAKDDALFQLNKLMRAPA